MTLLFEFDNKIKNYDIYNEQLIFDVYELFI